MVCEECGGSILPIRPEEDILKKFVDENKFSKKCQICENETATTKPTLIRESYDNNKKIVINRCNSCRINTFRKQE
jgi:hypothetical protein